MYSPLKTIFYFSLLFIIHYNLKKRLRKRKFWKHEICVMGFVEMGSAECVFGKKIIRRKQIRLLGFGVVHSGKGDSANWIRIGFLRKQNIAEFLLAQCMVIKILRTLKKRCMIVFRIINVLQRKCIFFVYSKKLKMVTRKNISLSWFC